MRNLLALSLLLFVCGCGSGPEFELPPPSSTRLPNAGDAPYYDKVNDLGFALLREMDTSKNVVFSPVSVAHTLAMLMHGSSNKAHDELLGVLGLTESNKEVSSDSQRALLNRLKSIDGRPMKTGSAVFAVWPVLFDSGYVEKMGKTYEGVAQKLGGATIEGKRLLDEWAKERTGGAISELGMTLSKDQQMMVVSVAHFVDDWQVAPEVRRGSFETRDGKVQVDRLGLRANSGKSTKFSSLQNDSISIVSYSFRGGEFQFFVFMPRKDNDLEALADAMDGARWRNIVANMKEINQDAALPKFQVFSDLDLAPMIRALGASSLFNSECNLRPMSIEMERGFAVSRMIHRAEISISAKGVQKPRPRAPGEGSGMLADITALRANGPFFFAVVDGATGAICLLGTVNDPTKN